MGNFPSSTTATLDDPRLYTNPAVGKYVPIELQLNKIYDEMMRVYSSNVDQWSGVDTDLLKLQLRAKLLKEYPQFFKLSSSDAANDAAAAKDDKEEDEEEEDAPLRKRRDIKGGPVIVNGLRVPREVVARIVPYFDDRSSVNNFSLTCRGALQVIQDRNVVPALPWPTKCPFQLCVHNDGEYQHFEDGCSLKSIVASNDRSRVAIVREREGRNDNEHFHDLLIFDRSQGLIGEMTYFGTDQEPVFSLDNHFLIARFDDEAHRGWRTTRGYQIFQFPIDKQVGPIAVSNQHNISHTTSRNGRLVFIGNSEIVTLDEHIFIEGGICCDVNIRKLNRENGSINLSDERQTIKRFEGDEESCRYDVSAFVGEKKTFVVVSCSSNVRNTLTFYDIKSKKSISRPHTSPSLADDSDDEDDEDTYNNDRIKSVDFSKNGVLVIISSKSGLAILDFANVKKLKDIGQARFISPSDEDISYWKGGASFSPDGTKIAVRYSSTYDVTPQIRIIDLDSEEVIADGWDDSAWNAFVN